MNFKISEDFIKQLHSLVVEDCNGATGQWKTTENIWKLRRNNEQIRIVFPKPCDIPVLIEDYIKFYNRGFKTKDYHKAIKTHCEIYLKFIAIHPFHDGNSRVARILALKPFTQNGFFSIRHPWNSLRFDRIIKKCFKIKTFGWSSEYKEPEAYITETDPTPMVKEMLRLSKSRKNK